MSTEVDTPIQISEACGCGAEFSVTCSRFASEWSRGLVADWREKHVCPLRPVTPEEKPQQ